MALAAPKCFNRWRAAICLVFRRLWVKANQRGIG
ncbi:hypothetical protein Msil_3034 [Methylocella silvestris BL2]|uniref:Uncharacterized protein n=1 Tax=Methylocella silvestris (strain DSM 15510 / CIP 108128 / LMG 27833 / NCIMB 13906 / BL2) TaxID=395965 RepID=B8EKR6_METSB|nr:hypothetical protein Msil_3034 [Methylocella silvestris BL2]